MEHNFQVDLRGIISILSKHLYSGAEVFLRELLQNAVDAIRAREKLEPDFKGQIDLHLKEDDGFCFVIQDNGVGLTKAEVHEFLATIGQSSKRGEDAREFIGQFGIGLLSAFLVADEITVLSRSVKPDQPSLRWDAEAQGRYQLQKTDTIEPLGSQVILRPSSEHMDLFDAEQIFDLARHFAAFLPYPIYLHANAESRQVNDKAAPWRERYSDDAARSEALFNYGQDCLGSRPFDVIDLKTDAGGLDGLAFVLPWTANLAAKPKHRLYIKNMLLSDGFEDLLPDWAFFVQCVLNAEDLHPTASRESVVQDELFDACQQELGEALKTYLKTLAQENPEKLKDFIGLHNLSLKALAVEDDDLFELIIPYLPFESSTGKLYLNEHLQGTHILRYCTDLNQFKQLARVAAAQRLTVINGAYVYATDLIEKYAQHHPEVQLERVDSASISMSFQSLSLEEREQSMAFWRLADAALKPFDCQLELAHFEPKELATLYVLSEEQRFLRSVEQTQAVVSNDLWAGVLDGLATQQAVSSTARLYMNMSNELTGRLVLLRDPNVIARVCEVLYAQALLLGHHSLSAAEMQLLNRGILDLIDSSVRATLVTAESSHGAN